MINTETFCCDVVRFSFDRGVSGAYRTDGWGLVGTDAGRTFVANVTEGGWTSYQIMTEEAVYDISLEVS